jgi:ankyrin repeat protein
MHLLKFRAEVDSLDSYGGTPLVAAALNGEVECVQALLDASADVNHATINLNTPLMKAALNGHVACVRVLLGWGADSTKINNAKKTAKDLAFKAMQDEENKLQEITAKTHNPRSIEEKRKVETMRRLEKRIADHKIVLKDLDMDKDQIRANYSDFFESQGSDAAVQTSDASMSNTTDSRQV